MALIVGPFALGVAVAPRCERSEVPLVMIALILSTWSAWRFPGARPLGIPILVFLMGIGRGALLYVPLSPNDLRLVVPEGPVLATVGGRIASNPRVSIFDQRPHLECELACEILQLEDQEPIRATGRILVRVPDSEGRHILLGRSIRVRGVLDAPRGPAFAGDLDPRKRWRHRGVSFVLQTDGERDQQWISSEPEEPPWTRRLRRTLRERLTHGLPEGPSRDLLVAITLGRVDPIPPSLTQPFRDSGTAHIFAVSGLHVGITIGALSGALRRLVSHQTTRALTMTIAMWIYIALVGGPDSAVRAGVMGTTLVWASTWRRPVGRVNSIALAGWLILLWDPGSLFDLGFQLSFLVITTLFGVDPPVREWLKKHLRADRWIPLESAHISRRFLCAAARHLARALADSTAISLVTIPLISQSFHTITPAAPIANTLLTPLAAPILLLSWAGILIDPLTPEIASVSLQVSHSLMTTLREGAEFFSRPAFGTRACSGLGAPQTTLLYTSAFLGIGTAMAANRKGGLLIMALGAGVAIAWSGASRPVVRLTALPVYGGAVAHFSRTSEERSQILFDCGSIRSAAQKVTPFLHARGINRVAAVILTHGDVDQVGGAVQIIESFSTQRIYASPVPFPSSAYRQARINAIDLECDWTEREAGDRLGPWTVVWPATVPLSSRRADDSAMALWTQAFGAPLLFIGELSPKGQRALVHQNPELKARILVAGLPDNGEIPAAEFLDHIGAEHLVLINQRWPWAKFAGPFNLHALRANGRKVWETSVYGAISVEATRNGLRITSPGGTLWKERIKKLPNPNRGRESSTGR